MTTKVIIEGGSHDVVIESYISWTSPTDGTVSSITQTDRVPLAALPVSKYVTQGMTLTVREKLDPPAPELPPATVRPEE